LSDKKTCCICGEDFHEWGNNPAPFTGEICCNDCNDRFVVPIRMITRDGISAETGKALKDLARYGKIFVNARKTAQGSIFTPRVIYTDKGEKNESKS
jgi:hypothetical protein